MSGKAIFKSNIMHTERILTKIGAKVLKVTVIESIERSLNDE